MRIIAGVVLVGVLAAGAWGAEAAGGYAVVVSRATRGQAAWKKVVDALAAKHGAKVVLYDKAVTESVEALRNRFPRYACFVATPREATRNFVAEVHRLTRTLDDDPYTDLLWGILTGYDAANALRIAQHAEPLPPLRGWMLLIASIPEAYASVRV